MLLLGGRSSPTTYPAWAVATRPGSAGVAALGVTVELGVRATRQGGAPLGAADAVVHRRVRRVVRRAPPARRGVAALADLGLLGALEGEVGPLAAPGGDRAGQGVGDRHQTLLE